MILPFCSALVKAQRECCVLFWAPQNKRGMELLERVQKMHTKIIKHLSHEEKLRGAVPIWFGEEKSEKGSYQCVINI